MKGIHGVSIVELNLSVWVELPVKALPPPNVKFLTVHSIKWGRPGVISTFKIVRRDYKRGKIWGVLV